MSITKSTDASSRHCRKMGAFLMPAGSFWFIPYPIVAKMTIFLSFFQGPCFSRPSLIPRFDLRPVERWGNRRKYKTTREDIRVDATRLWGLSFYGAAGKPKMILYFQFQIRNRKPGPSYRTPTGPFSCRLKSLRTPPVRLQ